MVLGGTGGFGLGRPGLRGPEKSEKIHLTGLEETRFTQRSLSAHTRSRIAAKLLDACSVVSSAPEKPSQTRTLRPLNQRLLEEKDPPSENA